jgi:protein-tyrosine phosphatase
MSASERNPIRVDFVADEHLGVPGRLGLTIAPGKKDGFTNRDLETDVRRLREHYHADCLVSLMEAFEYRHLGIEDLRERAEEAGLTVRLFPIRDVEAPPDDAMPRFLELIDAIVGDLRAGRTVVVHCRGGLGRSGVVAASCLVSLGQDPDDAIERVRLARPGAVENSVQERWVAKVAEALTSTPPSF